MSARFLLEASGTNGAVYRVEVSLSLLSLSWLRGILGV